MLEGLIKCLLIPPRSTAVNKGGSFYPPVIPMRENDRLLFSFCRTCSTVNKEGRKDPDYFCPHDDWKQRAFVATITSAELRLALSIGYSVKRLYRSYYFDEWSSELFKGYVKEFLRIKIQSSGWPPTCESAAARNEFMQKVLTDYGIHLDPAMMVYNPGMRYIAKVILQLTKFVILHYSVFVILHCYLHY
jgi:hypothetical protein